MSYLSSLFLALVSLSTRSRLRIALFSQLCCVIDADVLAIGVSHLVRIRAHALDNGAFYKFWP